MAHNEITTDAPGDPIDRWLVEDALTFVSAVASNLGDDHTWNHNGCPNEAPGETCGVCETVAQMHRWHEIATARQQQIR